ncbi:hypothetical protein EXIGLDRAFT_753485 [Exidia glandulosa HHB12029]|uniref:Uncharacterized protein n=1 Tax=Exidia glandulosa HHB12029 TaxID=1314781 RepID=A0A165DPZ3_EXIGL|nr:hypothetical protein EXIGLDRAFT_753485 [Exidia glandulosa HHB12029]
MLSAVTRRAFSSATAVRAERSMGKAVKDGVENVASKFQNTGSIGSKFEKGGDVAEVGEKVGGPFKSDGAIGKQFSAEEGGAVGGTGQAAARSAKQAAQESKEHPSDTTRRS